MLSAGMFSDFAARIAVRRRGFMSGSPPDFAAIAISLIRRVKILPRFASSAPFLCLIVAHFEWPDMGVPRGERKLIALILGIMDPPAEEITDQPRRKNVQAKGDYSMGRVPNPGWSTGDLALDLGLARPGSQFSQLPQNVYHRELQRPSRTAPQRRPGCRPLSPCPG